MSEPEVKYYVVWSFGYGGFFYFLLTSHVQFKRWEKKKFLKKRNSWQTQCSNKKSIVPTSMLLIYYFLFFLAIELGMLVLSRVDMVFMDNSFIFYLIVKTQKCWPLTTERIFVFKVETVRNFSMSLLASFLSNGL